MASFGPTKHRSLIAELRGLTPECINRVKQAFDNATDRLCLCIWKHRDSIWHIECPSGRTKETRVLFMAIRQSLISEDNAAQAINVGDPASRLIHGITNAGEDLEHLNIEVEGDEAADQPKALHSVAEEDEHEDKFIWRAEDPDIDLQQFLSESALEEFSHLFGAQLVLNPRQKAVALMNHADDGTIAEIYNRLCNVETWAHIKLVELHQILAEDKTKHEVKFPRLGGLPDNLLRRTLIEPYSNWKKELHKCRVCRLAKYDPRAREYKIVEINSETVTADVSWGYFRPETIKIKPVGDQSHAVPKSPTLAHEVEGWVGAVKEAQPSPIREVSPSALEDIGRKPSPRAVEHELLVDIPALEPTAVSQTRPSNPATDLLTEDDGNLDILGPTLSSHRIQPESDIVTRGTMNQNAPPKKGSGKQRKMRQNRAEDNVRRERLIDEIYGRPPPPARLPRPSTMAGKPTAEDPHTKELYATAITALENARTFQGELVLEVQLTENLLWFSTADSKDFADGEHTQEDAELYLNDQDTSTSFSGTATRMLTTCARDMEYLIGLKDADKQDVFDKEPHYTDMTFEIVCHVGRNQYRIIEVNQDGEGRLKGQPQAFGCMYWHHPQHIYDARVMVAGTHISSFTDYPDLRELMENLIIHYPKTRTSVLPEIQTHVTAKDFLIKWVYIKRRLDFKLKSPDYNNIVLRVTEVNDLVIETKAAGDIRAYAEEPAKMANECGMWYEASLIAATPPPQFEENMGLEVGCEAGWSPEDVLGMSRMQVVRELATKLVARMDRVGHHNQGPRGAPKELMRENEKWVKKQPQKSYW